MTFWNLLVILCFAVLYLGLAMVFIELRRLRDEIKVQNSPSVFPDPTVNPVEEQLAELRQDLYGMQDKLLKALNAMPAQNRAEMNGMAQKILPELDAIHRQIQYLERSMVGPSSTSNSSGGGKRTTGDAYQEAKLLLANGVDEDQVIAETGLTVEEVSLLKRLSQVQGNGM